MKRMGILGLASAALTLGMASMSAGVTAAAVEEPPKPKRKSTRKKKRAKAAPSYFTTRGKYIPGGEYRNCGERGISPKKLRT